MILCMPPEIDNVAIPVTEQMQTSHTDIPSVAISSRISTKMLRFLLFLPCLSVVGGELRGNTSLKQKQFRRAWLQINVDEKEGFKHYRLNVPNYADEKPSYEMERQLKSDWDSGDAPSIGISKKGGKTSKKSSKGSSRSSKQSKKDNVFSHSKSSKGSSSYSYSDDRPSYPTPTPFAPSPIQAPIGPTQAPNPPTQAPFEPPKRPPTEAPASPVECKFSNDLFGSQGGIAEVTEFAYQAIVDSTVTSTDLNLSILGKVETSIGEGILRQIFPQCSDGATSVQRSSNNQWDRRRTRFLQTGQLEGFSTRPRDTVVEGGMKFFLETLYLFFGMKAHLLSFFPYAADCANVNAVIPCFVIRGQVTSYTGTKMDEAMRQSIFDAIRDSVETGALAEVDDRLVNVSWRDLNEAPFPEENGGDDDGSGGDDNGNTDADDGLRSTDDDLLLPTWAIAVIAGGGSISLLMAYLCLRRRRPTGKRTFNDPKDLSSPYSDYHDGTKRKPAETVLPTRPTYRPLASSGKAEESESPSEMADFSPSSNKFGRSSDDQENAFGVDEAQSLDDSASEDFSSGYYSQEVDEEYEIEYVDDTEGLEGVDGEGVKKSEDFLDEHDDDSSSTSDAWK